MLLPLRRRLAVRPSEAVPRSPGATVSARGPRRVSGRAGPVVWRWGNGPGRRPGRTSGRPAGTRFRWGVAGRTRRGSEPPTGCRAPARPPAPPQLDGRANSGHPGAGTGTAARAADGRRPMARPRWSAVGRAVRPGPTGRTNHPLGREIPPPADPSGPARTLPATGIPHPRDRPVRRVAVRPKGALARPVDPPNTPEQRLSGAQRDRNPDTSPAPDCASRVRHPTGGPPIPLGRNEK